MNLYRKETGVPFINELVSGVYPYQYSTIPLIDWVDITSIVNNDLYGGYAADYVRATKEMAILFELLPGETEKDKWANCTIEEMSCLAKRMVINNNLLRLQIFTEEEDAYNFTQHAQASINCRELRIEFAKISMGYQLSVIDRVELFNSIQLMIESYVNTNDTSLTTWMNSEEGFKSQPYYTTVLLATYTEIVQNGIY